MPYRIVKRKDLIPGQTVLMVVDAPMIAAKARPGNFVILRVNDHGERIPLTIADRDPAAGTITIVFLVVGKSTALLATLQKARTSWTSAAPWDGPRTSRSARP
jgi:2-polyprenylphenol hydroxylase and related flavodoxin oxidoreductases